MPKKIVTGKTELTYWSLQIPNKFICIYSNIVSRTQALSRLQFKMVLIVLEGQNRQLI